MEPFPLDRLPHRSDWAGYLLDPTRDPPGDLEAYTDVSVYDGIYEQVLDRYREGDFDHEEFVLEIRGAGRENPGLISIEGDLFLARSAELVAREHEVVCDALAPVLDGGETVLALGCGWGANLGVIADEFPDVTVIGGEIAEHGVTVSRELHADEARVSVKQFDFHGAWELFDEHDDIVVFTRGALATLDDTGPVIDRLATRALDGDVIAGVHLEQTGPYPDDSVLGLLRRRYADVRGFDIDLLPTLREHPEISATHADHDVVGANPLHPQTAIRWRSA
jgi:Mycolic acid cyclopropane synthetase